jgi:hypothetical protein
MELSVSLVKIIATDVERYVTATEDLALSW